MQRLRLETRLIEAKRRSGVDGERREWPWRSRLLELGAGWAARLAGLHGKGVENARNPWVSEIDFGFPHLPPAFDGVRILHLSDLHVGAIPGLEHDLAALIAGIPADLAVMTGDFQSRATPSPAETARLMAPLVQACRAPEGILAVLGNHDEAALVDALEPLGMRLLLNESLTLRRGGDEIHVVGTDDSHAFHTPDAVSALAARTDGFRMALMHSVELAAEAEGLGIDLLLSGHTHGGQICLPGGRPVMTALDRHRRLAKGAWWLGRMQGYTSSGAGSGTPPLRFNSRPEVALITLRRG